jgi:hypothetical protein
MPENLVRASSGADAAAYATVPLHLVPDNLDDRCCEHTQPTELLEPITARTSRRASTRLTIPGDLTTGAS